MVKSQSNLKEYFIREEFGRILDRRQNSAKEMFRQNGVSYNKYFERLKKNYYNMPKKINTMLKENKFEEAFFYCSSAEGFFSMLGLASIDKLSGVIAAKIKEKDLSDLHDYTELLETLLEYILYDTSIPLAAVSD